MSEEVIKILDALAEKFGLAIDWTSTNVLPYLQKLCGKYVTYEIATSAVWILIGICLLFVGIYSIKKTKQCMFGILTRWAIVGGIAIIFCQIFDIVTCITFPEKIIIKELQLVYSSLK